MRKSSSIKRPLTTGTLTTGTLIGPTAPGIVGKLLAESCWGEQARESGSVAPEIPGISRTVDLNVRQILVEASGLRLSASAVSMQRRFRSIFLFLWSG